MSRDAADKKARAAKAASAPPQASSGKASNTTKTTSKTPTKTARPGKAVPVKPSSPKAAATPSLGWFERLKRLRLRFKRKGANIQLLLEDPAQRIAEIKRESAMADATEAASLGRALTAVLDRHESSRTVLAHLGVLEMALSRHGMKAFDTLPIDVLRRSMQQLETLVADWSPAALAALRARLKLSLVKRGQSTDRRGTVERLADTDGGRSVRVDEMSVTTFMEINAQWERSSKG